MTHGTHAPLGAVRFVRASDDPHPDETGGSVEHVHALARLLPDEPARRALPGANAAALYRAPDPR